jgi:hypothetical protein
MKCKEVIYCCKSIHITQPCFTNSGTQTVNQEWITITAVMAEKHNLILLLFSGQSWFLFGEYIKFLTNVFRLLIHEPLLRGVNTGVWCAMSAGRRIGRCFVRR